MVPEIITYNVFRWDRRPTSGAKVPERFILNNCLQESKDQLLQLNVTFHMEKEGNNNKQILCCNLSV